jgi:MFS family permease
MRPEEETSSVEQDRSARTQDQPTTEQTGASDDRRGGFGQGARTAAAASARGARRVGAATGRAARLVGTGTGKAAGFTFRLARRASHAQGAGQSGLSRLIELHAFNAAGDAAVAISLAGTLFFQVPTEQARSQVAMFLGMTMLPFAIVAPLIGPVLDRFGHGRRWAIGATMAVRAFLCWVLADAVSRDSVMVFPAALGVLVSSKAYTVTRAAAVPRLLPPQLTLVKANSRISLAAVVGAAVSAPLAVGASMLGSQWSLRYAFAVFVGGTILAVLLPARVDSSAGEGESGLPGSGRRRARVPATVVLGLRCNAGLRILSGFLTMFLAFLLRDAPFPGWEERVELLLGLVIGAAGVGSAIGIALGNLLRNAKPELCVVLALLVDTALAIVTASFYGMLTALALGVTAGLAQSFGKLSLDALIQRDIPEYTRASAFARSETLMQLSWVIGGFVGIALPLVPWAGFGTAAAILLAWCVWAFAGVRAVRHPAPVEEPQQQATQT